MLIISAALGEGSIRHMKEAAWFAIKHATLRLEPSCAGRWNTMGGYPRKRKRRQKTPQILLKLFCLSEPASLSLPLWAYLPRPLHQHWSLLLKEHSKPYFFCVMQHFPGLILPAKSRISWGFHIHLSQGSLLMKSCQETCLGFSVAFCMSQKEAKTTTEQ